MLCFLFVRCTAVGVRVWEVWVFHHADVVCILWQLLMLRSAWLAVCNYWLRMQEATIWKIGKSQTQSSDPLTLLSTNSSHPTHHTHAYHVSCAGHNTGPTCTTHLPYHQHSHTSSIPQTIIAAPSHTHTLSAYTHTTLTTVHASQHPHRVPRQTRDNRHTTRRPIQQ